MRIAVLSTPESWYYRDLLRAASGNHELLVVPHSDLYADVRDERTVCSSAGHNLSNMDAVIVRSMPPGSLEQVVLRMDVLGRLEASGVVVVNPPRSLETAIDKFLTTAKLREVGLDQPSTVACQTADQAMIAFERLDRDVVVKPLFGSEGRGITRITDIDLALRAFRMLEQLGAVIYLQRFVPHHGYDLRLFVLGESVYAIKRSNPLDWRTNVSRGATAEAVELEPAMAEIALRASKAIGAPIAGVDVLPGLDGRQYVIEVNAVPGWRALAKTLNLDVAAAVLNYIHEQTRTR